MMPAPNHFNKGSQWLAISAFSGIKNDNIGAKNDYFENINPNIST